MKEWIWEDPTANNGVSGTVLISSMVITMVLIVRDKILW